MSTTSIRHIPAAGVRPKAHMTSWDNDIPILQMSDDVRIQFHYLSDAAAYCRELARVATWLADWLEGHHAETEMVKTG